MTITSTRPLAMLFAGLVAAALWLPTLTVPVDAQFATAPVAIVLA